MIQRLVPLALALCAGSLAAQVKVRAGVPVALAGEAPQDQGGASAVQMFESQNVDRFLRKAKDFLLRERFDDAIKVLQDVVEGRTSAIVGDEKPPDPAKPEAGKPDPKHKPPANAAPAVKRDEPFAEEDATRSVFSDDGRLYVPVRRLCQRLLASMSPLGLELYRAKYEVVAQHAFEDALAARELRALEEVYERYFVTIAAGRALLAAGDLLMDLGRFRAALQAYQTLLEVYPEKDRAGIVGEIPLRVKMVVCFHEMNEVERMGEEIARIAKLDAAATVRLLGELTPVTELAKNPLFAVVTQVARERHSAGPRALHGARMTLVPLWEQRFGEPEPYKSGAPDRQQPNFVAFGDGGSVLPAPRAEDFKPGTMVSFVDGRLVFLNHHQIREHDLLTGQLTSIGNGSAQPPKPKTGQPRVRIPVYDWATLRVREDQQRWYFVMGPDRVQSGGKRPELNTELVATDRTTMSRVWGTRDIAEQNVKDLTILASPTIFGTKLIAPILDRGAYGLQCLDAATGKPIWRVHTHVGGSELIHAACTPITVDDGVAYFLTSAGTVAAVDAFTGDLRWARKYEIDHPFRPPPARVKQSPQRQWGPMGYYSERSLSGLGPSEMIVSGGQLIFAPVDSNVVLCLDGATGEALWMQGRTSNTRYLIGANERHVFLGGPKVTCIDRRSGILLWDIDVPASSMQATFPGRGVVTAESVILPDERCLQILADSDLGKETWRRVALPNGSKQDEPLRGPFNLSLHGPYLACAYEGGVEVYAAAEALEELAQQESDPGTRADYLVAAGDIASASLVLESVLMKGGVTGPAQARLASRALGWMRESAIELAAAGHKAEALALLDRSKPWLSSKELLLRWRLARIFVLETAKDMAGVDAERRELSREVEGLQ